MVVKCEVLNLVFGQESCHEAVFLSYENLRLNLVFEEPHDVKLLLKALLALFEALLGTITSKARDESANVAARCLISFHSQRLVNASLSMMPLRVHIDVRLFSIVSGLTHLCWQDMG